MLRSIVILLALLILSGIAACGGSGDETPATTTSSNTGDSAISPTPTPTAVPLPPPTTTPTPIPATAEPGPMAQKEPQSPRPGDEVFNLCQSDYGLYVPTSPEILRHEWTIDAYIQGSPDGSRILFSGPPTSKPGPVALYSVDPAGHSLQKIVRVPDFPRGTDLYSRAANDVITVKIMDVPGRDPVWGHGSSMMYFDIFPDSSKIVYSTCAYTRGDIRLEEIVGIELWDLDQIRSIVVSDFDETENAQRAEQGSRWVYNYEIVLSDINGTNTKRLTENTHFDNFPTVSPDGTKIAFIAGPRPLTDGYGTEGERIVLHTVSTDKSKEIVLPQGVEARPHPLKWSPDGERLAFVAIDYSRPQKERKRAVYTIGADGSGLTPITEAVSAPAWSPDSRRLAVAVPRGRNKASLYTFAPDGSRPRLISTSLPRSWGFPRSAWMGDLTWSPDATELLLKDHGYAVPLDGSPPVNYGPPKIPYGDDLEFSTILNTSWSPDGSKIAIRSLSGFPRKDKDAIVYIQDRDGTNIRSLVEAVNPRKGNIIKLTNEEQ